MSYLKNVAKALLGQTTKSIIQPQDSWFANGAQFIWDTNGYQAYNNKIFYTGANLIVRKMLEAPLTFNTRKKSNNNKQLEKFYSKTINSFERNAIKASKLDLIEEHELYKLINKETLEDFWFRYQFGAGVLFFETVNSELSRSTKPVAVWSLDFKRMTPIYDYTERYNRIVGYKFTCYNGELIDIDIDNLLYLNHWNPKKEYQFEFAPNVAASMDIALNQQANEAEGMAFVNGGRGTLFSGKSETHDGQVINKLSSTQMSALKETISRDMAGARNNRRMHYTNGEVIVTPYGDTLAEMELNKSEDSRWRNIYAIMGIPKELTPVSFNSSENSYVQGYTALVTNLIISELRKFDERLTKKIQKWFPGIVAISDITEYKELATDLKMMKEVFGTPSITEDERRELFGYEPIGGVDGSAILVPMNLQKLSDVAGADPFNDIEQQDSL